MYQQINWMEFFANFESRNYLKNLPSMQSVIQRPSCLLVSVHVISDIIRIICDVIWENMAYGGVNNAFLDQPFPCLYS